MSITQWAAGTLYQPGSLVLPSTKPVLVLPDLTNGDFESGDSGWTKTTNVTIDQVSAFSGTWSAAFAGISATPSGSIKSDTFVAVTAGQALTFQGYYDIGNGTDPNLNLQLNFYSANNDGAFISSISGLIFRDGVNGEWMAISMSGVVPDGALFVKPSVTMNVVSGTIRVDNLTWDLGSSAAASSFVFKATQAVKGSSGSDEPVWPTTLSGTVVDNEVTWTAVIASTVTWKAEPILKSGSTEPTWPLVAGAFIIDGTIAWECTRLSIEDTNCPQTREVAIGASKIFAGDNDVTRFSATLDPRDWTTSQDAGFLPSGLQQGAQIGVSALGMYRGNLVIWSESSLQVWQIDPDPTVMALIDAMEGIGSAHHKAVQPVSNDLFFLSALGVRTVGVAAASTNLAAGDAGVPIDILVQAEVSSAVDPISTYYPSAGQYWLAFPPFTVSAPA